MPYTSSEAWQDAFNTGIQKMLVNVLRRVVTWKESISCATDLGVTVSYLSGLAREYLVKVESWERGQG